MSGLRDASFGEPDDLRVQLHQNRGSAQSLGHQTRGARTAKRIEQISEFEVLRKILCSVVRLY